MGDLKRKRTLGPPPRWLHCPRKGTIIVDKFIAFKTPLDTSYDSQVPLECSFSPSMIIGSLSNTKSKIGLWIDLTNTTRFYDKNEVEGRNIKYVKLECRGHGECPNVDQTNTFIRICQQFISQHPLEIIGVHCTHGFNRTGFLIVSYLIESLSWGVEAAVHVFSQARPPGIYKADYLKELFKRYGDVNDAPPAPPLPEWCNDLTILPYKPASRRNYRPRRGNFRPERLDNPTRYHLVNSREQHSYGDNERQHPYRGDRYRWNSNRRQDVRQIPYPRAGYLHPYDPSWAPDGAGLARPFSEAFNVYQGGADMGVARGPDMGVARGPVMPLVRAAKPIYRNGDDAQSAHYSNRNAAHFPESGSFGTWQQPGSRHWDNSEVPPGQMGIEQSYRNPYATDGSSNPIPNYFARTPQ